MERAAVELGIESSEVESLPFDLSTLESEGIFMKSIAGFGSLAQLQWRTLGVNAARMRPCGSAAACHCYGCLSKQADAGALRPITLLTNTASGSLSARQSGEQVITNGYPGKLLISSSKPIIGPVKPSQLLRLKFLKNTTRFSPSTRTASINSLKTLLIASGQQRMTRSTERDSSTQLWLRQSVWSRQGK